MRATFSGRFLGGRAKNRQGLEIALSPAEFLAVAGPKVNVRVGVSGLLRRFLLSQEKEVPDLVEGSALMDTGASHSCIDEGFARRLGLPIIDEAAVSTASHSRHRVNVYGYGLIAVQGSDVRFDAPRLIGADLEDQGIEVLLGRDFLSMGILIYNGHDGSFSFSL